MRLLEPIWEGGSGEGVASNAIAVADDGKHAISFSFACKELIEGSWSPPGRGVWGEGVTGWKKGVRI